MTDYQEVRFWVPGRNTRRVARQILVLAIIFLIVSSSVFPQLSSVFNTLFGREISESRAEGKGGNTSGVPDQAPGVSLPPGTIQFGSRNGPRYGRAADWSVPPHLMLTMDSYVYQTSFGTYSFDRSAPFSFSLQSQSGALLTDKSFFFVKSSSALTVGTSTVTEATDSLFQVRSNVLMGPAVVGQMLLRVDYKTDVRPKFTIRFDQAVLGGLDNFNIIWTTLPTQRWLRVDGSSVSDLHGVPGIQRIAGTSKLDIGPSSDSESWTEWLTTDWSDAPGGALDVGFVSLSGFQGFGQMVVFPANQRIVDPTQISTSTVNYSTSYSTQRKVITYGGKYYAFFYSGSNIIWKSSLDQVTWSTGFVAGGGTGYGGAIGYSFDLHQSGSTIALVWLYYNASVGGDHTNSLYFRKGTIFAGDISWTSPVKVVGWSQPYSWPPSVAIGTDGTFWAAGIWQDSNSKYNIWIYRSGDGSNFALSTNYFASDTGLTRTEALQLVPLPQGKLMALSSHYADTTIRWKTWSPFSPTGPNWSSVSTFNLSLPLNTNKWNILSSTATPDSFVHLVFEQFTATYQILWSYYNTTSNQWTIGPSLYSCTNQCLYPTVSSDALGNLYAFWMSLSSGVPTYLMYSTRLKGQSWSAATQPFGSGTNIQKAVWLSASRSATREVTLSWTLNTTSPYPVFFGSIPLPPGIASSPPNRAWSNLGLSPNEQYFTQNGEYVSPGNGLLTVSQSDISVQGRSGLSLSITRVYVQPFTILQGTAFNYETSPYANLGSGWQLNVPWVGPQFLHFLGGEIFPLIYATSATTTNSTYQVTTWTFENHQTEDFLFTRTNTTNLSTHVSTITYKLTAKDGTVYNFNGTGSLTSIVDRTGQNQITFAFTGNILSSITDTVGRTAILKYNPSNYLANVTYGGQVVKYGYSGSNLVTVTDAVNRVTTLKYSAQNSWLLSGVIYTTGGNSSYTFGSMSLGTDATNYYVTLQNVFTGSIVKTSSFSYNITDGEVSNTSVKQSDGINVQGYTNYLFNSQSNSLTRTILNATVTQMRKEQFWYDPATGRSVQQDIYSGTSLTRSFYNSRFYDLWGNVIYTRDNIGRESYSSFANTESQYMFQGSGSLSTSTNGKRLYDDFNGFSLNTTAWAKGGSGVSSSTIAVSNLLKLTTASSSQGTWKSNWVKSTSTFGYPFYAEVQTENWYAPGTETISADFFLSPQATASNGNPFDNADYLRLSLRDTPIYKAYKRVSGGAETSLWTGTSTGTHSITWKIILTDRNTLTVYLNRGRSSGYEQVYSTTSLGLSTSFTPAYVYLSLENLNTATYYATFDYVGLSTSNSVTVNTLQAGQKVELYDWNDILQASGTVAVGQTSITLDATQMVFPYGYFKIYELDGRTVQFVSPTREVWGGSTYSYTKPFRSGGVTRTSTGFLQSSTVFVDDSLPSGAISYSDGGDVWAWTNKSLTPVVSASLSHVGFPVTGTHEHYFNASTTTLTGTSGYYLIQYVYIPSSIPPSEIMLQFHTVSGTWEHRAYWGSNSITACGTSGSTCGTNGTPSRLPMGALPIIQNSWVMLIVKTDDVAVNGLNINGWAYTLYNGGIQWDYSAIGTSSTGTITINNLLAGQKVEVYDSINILKASGTVAVGQTSITLNLYSAGINAFPFKGYVKVYTTANTLQYSSPLMTDIWGGDVYSYNQPVFTNRFDPGTIGITIHTSLIGTAQYQNGTSVNQETYSKYDSVANTLRDSKLHNGGLLNTTYTYDTYGNRISELNPNNQQTYYSFSATYQRAYLTNTTRVLNANTNATTSYVYTFSTGNQIAMIDSKGNRTDYQYDALSRITIVQYPAIGGSRSEVDLTYTDAQNNFDIRNEKGNYTRSTYDSLGRITTVDKYTGLPGSPVLSEDHVDYQWQNYVQNYNASGPITTYTYDYLGRLVKATNIDGTYTIVSYDDLNLIQSNYDENGHRTDQVYDPLQRLVGVREYYSSSAYYSTTYTYDSAGNLAKSTAANQQILSFTPTDDAYIEQANPNTNFGSGTTLLVDNSPVRHILLKFNVVGVGSAQVVSAKLRLYDVDPSNNGGDFYKTATSTWSESTVTWNNAPATTGSVIASLGSVAANTWYLVDLTSAVTGDGVLSLRVTSTSSDGADYTSRQGTSWFIPQLIVTISTGQTITYSYDDLNRVTLTKYPDGFNETRTYDNIGNLINKKDPNGNTITYTYDNLNRLANITYPDGTKANFAYDKNGNRIYMSNPNTTATFGFDARNRLTSETWTIDGSQYTINHGYDAVGNLASITYPDSVSVTYSIDPLNRATTVKKGSSSLANITYTPSSLVRTISYSSGVATTYTYDSRDRVSRIKTVRGGSTLLDLNYTLDNVGNVLGINTESYGYDFLNRLTYSSGPWPTLQYGYDAIGNRLWMKEGATNSTYVYGTYNRLLSAGSTSYTYDNNGNLRSETSSSTTTVYNYDFEDRLTKVTQGASTLGAYAYNPFGVRIKKVESGTTTIYLNQGVNVLYEKQGSLVNDYVRVRQLLLAKLSGTNTYYFHQDHLGSSRLVTIGATTDFSSNYQSYGAQYSSTGTDPVYKYSGKPQDSATGLYYYGARYYDSSSGRFISRDPTRAAQADPQGLSAYPLARNNPETLVDPDGRLYWLPNITGMHCHWTYCDNLFVARVGLGPLDVIAIQAGRTLSTAVGCLAATVAAPICWAVSIAAGAIISAIAAAFTSTDGNLYIYFLVVLRSGISCSWWGCTAGVASIVYGELGVYTNMHPIDYELHRAPLGYWAYIPLYNWWGTFYGYFAWPRTNPWPSGY